MPEYEKHTVKGKLTAQQVHELLCKYGKEASETAKRLISQEKIENNSVREALHYFMQDVWHDEEYPGFMALACKTVGGEPNKTSQLGASIILMRGAMDIHDDIIDQQAIKSNGPTLYGKCGQDISIIVGDALFYKGIAHFYETISQLQKKEGQTIADIVRKAILEVGTGIASEIDCRGNLNLPPENLVKIITHKSACADACAKIGAIIGGGNEAEVDALGRFGTLFAVLTMMRDEFIDIYEPEELQNRKEKECLPLPLLFAFQDKDIKNKILPILEKRKLSNRDAETIIRIISRSKGVRNLKNQMKRLKKTALSGLEVIGDKKSTRLLANLLDAVYEDL